VLETDSFFLIVEISHLAGLHGGQPKCKSRLAGVDEIEVDNCRQQLLEGIDEIHRRLLDADARIGAPGERRIYLVEAGHSDEERRQLTPRFRHAAIKLCPELPQPLDPIDDFIPGDNGAIDGSNRRADHPIGLDARFMKRLVGAGLIAPRRPATLHHQYHPAWKARLVYWLPRLVQNIGRSHRRTHHCGAGLSVARSI